MNPLENLLNDQSRKIKREIPGIVAAKSVPMTHSEIIDIDSVRDYQIKWWADDFGGYPVYVQKWKDLIQEMNEKNAARGTGSLFQARLIEIPHYDGFGNKIEDRYSEKIEGVDSPILAVVFGNPDGYKFALEAGQHGGEYIHIATTALLAELLLDPDKGNLDAKRELLDNTLMCIFPCIDIEGCNDHTRGAVDQRGVPMSNPLYPWIATKGARGWRDANAGRARIRVDARSARYNSYYDFLKSPDYGDGELPDGYMALHETVNSEPPGSAVFHGEGVMAIVHGNWGVSTRQTLNAYDTKLTAMDYMKSNGMMVLGLPTTYVEDLLDGNPIGEKSLSVIRRVRDLGYPTQSNDLIKALANMYQKLGREIVFTGDSHTKILTMGALYKKSMVDLGPDVVKREGTLDLITTESFGGSRELRVKGSLAYIEAALQTWAMDKRYHY